MERKRKWGDAGSNGDQSGHIGLPRCHLRGFTSGNAPDQRATSSHRPRSLGADRRTQENDVPTNLHPTQTCNTSKLQGEEENGGALNLGEE